jgi:hypothetical protein
LEQPLKAYSASFLFTSPWVKQHLSNSFGGHAHISKLMDKQLLYEMVLSLCHSYGGSFL